MAREGRQKSASGVYHVLLRGVDKLFLQEEDYSWFRDRLKVRFGGSGARLLAYLLLPNRAHLLIDEGTEELSLAVKPLCTSYARYFNRTYKEAGKLFYDRFKSVPCETEEEISDTAAFLHEIGRRYAREENSSLSEYENGARLCDTARLLQLCGGRKPDKAHTLHLDDYDRLTREELAEYLHITAGCDIEELAKMDRHTEPFITLFSGRGATARKLLPIFGVYPCLRHEKQRKTEEPKPSEPPKPAQRRDLSVWLL